MPRVEPRAALRAETTVRDAVRAAQDRLRAAGCDSPRLDAELLLAHVLGADRAALYRDPGRMLSAAAADAFAELVARRAEREPVAYLVGRRAFRTIELDVDARVLVPRPETELLVEVALDLPRGARVVDVGTGSGAVALALKAERPDLDIRAADVDPGAVAVARANAARLGLDVPVVVSDLLAGVPGPIDAVLANLPYVAEGDLPGLAPEIARHEPRIALAGGPDGLELVRRLAAQLAGVERVALEVGAGQSGATAALLRAHGYRDVAARRDLAGVERVVAGTRR